MQTRPALYLQGMPLSLLLDGLTGWILIQHCSVGATQNMRDAAPEWIAAYHHEIIRRCDETSLGGSE